MVAGLRVENASGSLQIDERYANLVLVQKHEITINQRHPWGSASTDFYNFSLSLGGLSTPCVAIRATGDSVFLWQAESLGGGSWRYSFSSRSPTSATVYVFDGASQLSASSGAGLWVWDASSRLVFDSNLRYCNIKNIFPRVGQSGTYSSSAELAAVVQTFPGFQWVPVPLGPPPANDWPNGRDAWPGFVDVFCTTYRTVGNSVFVSVGEHFSRGHRYDAYYGNQVPEYMAYEASFLVVDVSGL